MVDRSEVLDGFQVPIGRLGRPFGDGDKRKERVAEDHPGGREVAEACPSRLPLIISAS